MAWAMLPGLMNLTRMSASGGMEPGIELVVRVLLGGAAIRPSVGAPPTTCCCQSALEVVEKVVTGHRGTGCQAPLDMRHRGFT